MTGASALGMIATALTPEGRVKKAVKLICGMAAVLTLLGGVTDFDYTAYSRSMADYRQEAERFIGEYEDERSQLEKEYIKERCEAYISDRGSALGFACGDVSVTVRWSADGYWYPYSLTGTIDGDASTLKNDIASELGIPPDRQIWSIAND